MRSNYTLSHIASSPERIIRSCILSGMDPREFLRRLMEDRRLNPNSLSALTRHRTKQPQIHRFLTGEAREPKRSTLQPLAEVLGVPVEAFFSAAAAQAAWESRNGGAQQPKTEQGSAAATEPPATPAGAVSLAQALEAIGIALAADMPDDVRQDVADLLSKLAHRKGAARHQEELLALLQAARPGKLTGTNG